MSDVGQWVHASRSAVIAAAGTVGWSVTSFLLGFLVCFIAFVRGWL